MDADKEINPFDILSGKVVQLDGITYVFKGPGNNINENGIILHQNIKVDFDDLLSGKVVKNKIGTFWFKNANSYNLDVHGYPICERLHRVDGPAAITYYGTYWYLNGKQHRLDGPAYVHHCRGTEARKAFYVNGWCYSNKQDFGKAVNEYKNRSI